MVIVHSNEEMLWNGAYPKGVNGNKRIKFCEYNMDTACVKLKFSNGSMIFIDTIAVGNEVADNMYQRSELDRLIHNRPLKYVQFVLVGNLEQYVQGTPEHRLMY